ncbi:hypothetical protein C1701_23520 [Actinoalloteichus sp. AHMU CJ021]|uniref:SDR family NAD(P)-dependent oxidoreductase n=1 Tax=Actinoalloteichus TaxID=65496 RepID=UPI000CA02FEE|nr:hypothetical protein C1701_23520 [Actinoalloteichus sp. AHMU CJ021]
MTARFDGNVVVVTGAGQGIGAAIARSFAEQGATVVVTDIRADTATTTAIEINAATGATVLARPLDVTRSAEVAALADQVVAEHGRVDVLVNNAGIVLGAASFDYDDDTWNRTLAVNLSGPFYTAREFGRRMRGRGGAIVNVSSVAALRAPRADPHIGYDATKAGVIALTRSLAAEWAPEGIRVNAVAPGYTNTDILKAVGSENPEVVAGWRSHIPQGRLAEPVEIAQAVRFLASTEASAVTGHVLVADGGYSTW